MTDLLHQQTIHRMKKPCYFWGIQHCLSFLFGFYQTIKTNIKVQSSNCFQIVALGSSMSYPCDNRKSGSAPKSKLFFFRIFCKQTKSEKRLLKKIVDTYEFHPGRKDIPQVCCSLIWPWRMTSRCFSSWSGLLCHSYKFWLLLRKQSTKQKE